MGKATGVFADVAVIKVPLALKTEGLITHAVFRAIVPVVEIVPPVSPVPAVTDVTVPLVTEVQVVSPPPLEVKTCPAVPRDAEGIDHWLTVL